MTKTIASLALLILFGSGGFSWSQEASVEAPEKTTPNPAMHHHPEKIREHSHHETQSILPVGIALSAAWDSRYVSEGRDNLNGDGLLGATLELSYKNFMLGLWYGDSPENRYNEFNASLEYTFELADFEFVAGYTHLRYMNDFAHDNEVGAGIAYQGFDWGIVPALDWYYSFWSGGSFLEFSATREFEVASWLTLEPGVVLGVNAGYLPFSHKGWNHLATALSASIPLGKNVELGGNLSYSWGLDRDAASNPGDQRLKDMFYGGVSVVVSF